MRLREHVASILRGNAPSGLRVRVGLTLACGAAYGAAMGSFGLFGGDGPLQMPVSALKVPLFLLGSFAISLPSFFVLNALIGLGADFPRAARVLAGGQAALTLVLAALAPYTLLWYASSDHYRAALLFNGLAFAIATFAAQILTRRGYRELIARHPRHRWLLRFWLVLYSFVAIQMAWILRPFVGAPGIPVQFLRPDSWDNAYVMLARMIRDAVWTPMVN